jgi:hypothetical protein
VIARRRQALAKYSVSGKTTPDEFEMELMTSFSSSERHEARKAFGRADRSGLYPVDDFRPDGVGRLAFRLPSVEMKCEV